MYKFTDLLGRFFIRRSKRLHSSVSLLVPRKLAVTLLNLHQCDNRFLGRFRCYHCYNNPEGNMLAATEFVTRLEVSKSVTANRSHGRTENTQLLGSNSREFNPIRAPDITRI